MSDPNSPEIEGLAQAAPDLRHAGAVVDQAIEYMTKEKIDPISIASALLGGALGMLASNLPREAILAVLDQARASVQSGEMDSMAHPPAKGHA
jgi:hypothetical protein